MCHSLSGGLGAAYESPSIIPNDCLDRDFYIVLENFRDGACSVRQANGLTGCRRRESDGTFYTNVVQCDVAG
jgi:hypothetical protein